MTVKELRERLMGMDPGRKVLVFCGCRMLSGASDVHTNGDRCVQINTDEARAMIDKGAPDG